MLETSYPSQVFRGVHFTLFGFNPVSESNIRFKLVNGGGVDAGKYGANCSHVIVDKIAYDDPVCVAARKDGKTLVTALWVDHSADIGMPVDPASVMYRPLKDLNGIPGAQKLIMCLTGYLRQDRDDIMTMVGLMGAHFSKPLVANKVTHLICYKFEGEKYELAKKMGTIKLVNHRWLEDCLRDWILLPEDKYNKSGYELEALEAEAKDSEEEAEDSKLGQSGGRNMNRSPLSSKFGHGLTKSAGEPSNATSEHSGRQVLPKVNNGEGSVVTPQNKNISGRDLSFHYIDNMKISAQAADVSIHATSSQMPDTYVKISASKNAEFSNAISSGLPPDPNTGTSESKKLVCDLRSSTASAERLTHSDAKFNSMSYSKKNQRGFTLPRNLDECSGNATGPAVSPLDDFKFGNNLETSSTEVENASEGIKYTCIEGSGKGNDFIKGDDSINLLPQKRIKEASSTKLKTRKMTTDGKLSKERTPLSNGKYRALKMASLVNEPHVADGCVSAGIDGVSNSNICSISKSEASNSKSMAFDEPFSRNASLESAQCDNACQSSAQAAVQSLRESKIMGKPDFTGFEMREVDDGHEAEQHKIMKNLECSSPGNKKLPNEELIGLVHLDLSNKESGKLIRKSPRKKSVAKKSSGRRPKVGDSAKQKRSVSLNETTVQGEGVSFFSGSEEIATCDLKKLQASPEILNLNKEKEEETIGKYAEDAGGRTKIFDDETEAPDDKYEDELGMSLDENKSELVHVSKTVNTTNVQSKATHNMAEYEETMPPKSNKTETKKQKPPSLVDSTSELKVKHKATKRPAVRTKKTTVTKDLLKSAEAVSVEKNHNERRHEAEMEIPGEMPPLADISDQSTSKLVVKHQRTKRPACRTKKTTLARHFSKSEEAAAVEKNHNESKHEAEMEIPGEMPSERSSSKLEVKHQLKKSPAGRTKKCTVAKKNSEEAVSVDKIHTERENEAEMELLEEIPPPADLSESSTTQRNKSDSFIEENKENRPIDGAVDAAKCKSIGSRIIKSIARPVKVDSKKMGPNSTISEANTKAKTEAACFLVSGHRLQRKEFQQVIKRLKGRVCRDSHQWSYQATHFIVPDPVRRTEKFFAAAASGRWILKTDFLTASTQAGKLLPEGRYEWHKSGLTEDGAINMEAPRKWRLLRERTGHGAFYGMRIIVYGDCIAPPLDTLKRVIKSGDGTILATSPPYTRFLDTGVDYAIVSPGMPRVDVWVQEFLKHEIPCVLADYLVEYVCKPGFSLERHVLYGTHTWAERSYDKLQSKAEEIVEELIPPKDCDEDNKEEDTICRVCGSGDRGDVMLICGDEKSSVGCGVGTHIDCCDPPLTEVPEEDWFCPKCNETSKLSNSSKKRKKGAMSSSKRE
ncbi:hypothetical protein TanjilG_16961 [Lupinus angustifolius]|uniref:BRCT domain-containing protein At4g02110 n=1 Tax=Lupinus angustifolius TaxID=3871 RepID=UPI00090D43E2|nr:PREDICTED: BRCT domain-containing protein At4g02110 [Lupinus angustifolius]OIV91001.1 hypothetical protein TanjilG_16961 [Lupinus angustifolius]